MTTGGITPGGSTPIQGKQIGQEQRVPATRREPQVEGGPAFTGEVNDVNFGRQAGTSSQQREQGTPIAEATTASQARARNPVAATASSPTVIPMLDAGQVTAHTSSEAPFVPLGALSTKTLGQDPGALAAVAGGRETAAAYVATNWYMQS